MKAPLMAVLLLAATQMITPAFAETGEVWRCKTDQGAMVFEIKDSDLFGQPEGSTAQATRYDIDEDSKDRVTANRIVSGHRLSLVLDKVSGHFQTRLRINSYRDNNNGTCKRD